MQIASRLSALREREIDDILAPLRQKFTDDLPTQAATIDALMLAAEAVADPTRLLRDIQGVVHRLAGVAAMLGFADVGRLAQRSETAIVSLIGGSVDAPLDEIGGLLDDLVMEMEHRRTTGPSFGGPADAAAVAVGSAG